MPKFLMYSSEYVSEECATDFKVFFQDNFRGAEVILWHLGQTLDGFSKSDEPTFVVPGGFMWAMYNELKPEFNKIAEHINQKGFHYIGSCAGAYIACDEIIVSKTAIENNILGEYRQVPTNHKLTTRPGMGLLPGVSSFGPLYPHPFQTREKKPVINRAGQVYPFMPYSFAIKPFDADSFSASYLSGCGFTIADDVAPTIDVLAVYPDLLIHGHVQEYKEATPAVLYRPGQGLEGNVLVSSAHLETCVPTSSLLKAIGTLDSTQYDSDSGKLSREETDQLEDAVTKSAQTQFLSNALKRLYLPR